MLYCIKIYPVCIVVPHTGKKAKELVYSGVHNWNTGKKSRFFKVFKVPGKKCITTVSKENFEKKSDGDNGGISPTKSSTISCLIQAYKY